MLITRETDYAIRILRGLSGGELLTAGELSQREGVPQQFAYKIIKKLEKQELIQILRGAGGGCRLSADLKTVTLYDLMKAMDEDTLVISCMDPDYQCTRPGSGGSHCGVHQKLCQIQGGLHRELKSHTLHSLIFDEE